METVLAYVATPTAVAAMVLAVVLALRLADAWKTVAGAKTEVAIYSAANERQAGELAKATDQLRNLAAQGQADKTAARAALVKAEGERDEAIELLAKRGILPKPTKDALSR